MIRVALADDQELVRTGFAALLDAEDDIDVVGQAADGWEAAGLSNDEIAGRLYVISSTARTHATRAMAKLHARDRAQLVVFAYQAGLAHPGWTS